MSVESQGKQTVRLSPKGKKFGGGESDVCEKKRGAKNADGRGFRPCFRSDTRKRGAGGGGNKIEQREPQITGLTKIWPT